MSTSCIVFYSSPIESSKTAIIRGLEVCCCNVVYIVSTMRRADEIRSLCKVLNSLVRNIEFKALPIIPDTNNSPELINEVVVKLKEVGLGKGPTCFIASAGSRLEVASMSLVLNRSSTDVIYISFLWGPWKGTYYPFTPKAIQLAHILHPSIEAFNSCRSRLNINIFSELLSYEHVPGLRREVLSSQISMNSKLTNRCIASRPDTSFSCSRVTVSATFHGREVLNIEASDYCSWNDILRLCDDVSSEVNRLCESLNSTALCRTLSTLLNVAGIKLLTVEDCVGIDCVNARDLALVDFLVNVNDIVITDTNVIYQGIHNYLYEYPELSNILSIPLSTYVELYEHQVHTLHGDLYSEVRAEISRLLIDELRYFRPRTDVRVTTKPSEVGIALVREGVAVTSDRRAFNKLYKWLGRKSLLTSSIPVSKILFKSNERSRRVSYAYYALTQLKALSRLLNDIFRRYGLSIEVILH